MAGKTKSVKEIFKNMDYGNIKESYDLAKTWIEKQGSIEIPNDQDIQKTFQSNLEQWHTWRLVPVEEKYNLLNKLADEIEKHANLICQIELHTRQILIKDTKNRSIKLMTDYLRYYSGWTFSAKDIYKDYKPHHVCDTYLSHDTPLSFLGAILGPALAAGSTVVLGSSPKTIYIWRIIAELCKNVGFPENVVSVVPVQNCEEFMYNSSSYKFIYVGNLHDKTLIDFKIENYESSTLLHLAKSSAIIFDTADIDSAIDSIVEWAWAYKIFPHGINQLYVQESIFTEFIKRFKAKLLKLNVEYIDNYLNKNTDVLIPKEIIANNIKLDIINKIPVQFGYKTFGGSILTEEENNILSILAFRTANEAIALSNNNKFGLATSVWTENVNLANEVSFKLKSSIIWINTHGYINANTAFSPIKSSGKGYFGGKEGLLEYLILDAKVKLRLPQATKNESYIFYGGSLKIFEGNYEYPNEKDIRNCVEIAKKSFETWNKIQIKERRQHLLKLADASESLKLKNANLAEIWTSCLRKWALLYDSNDSSFQKSNPELKITKEPLGLIAVQVINLDLPYLQLIVSALMAGNAIIILVYDDDAGFLLELCKIISSSRITPGVFNVIFNPNADIDNNYLLTHREISRHFYSGSYSLLLKQLQFVNYFEYVNPYSFDILNIVTSNKCIWTSVNESFL